MKPILIYVVWGISALLLGAAWASYFVFLAPFSELLVVHFEGGRGIDFFGSKQDVLSIIGIGTAAAFINTVLAMVLCRKDAFLSYLLAFGTLFISLLILLTVAVIISVN